MIQRKRPKNMNSCVLTIINMSENFTKLMKIVDGCGCFRAERDDYVIELIEIGIIHDEGEEYRCFMK